MRISKRKIEKAGIKVLFEKWDEIFKELDAYRKIARVQRKYYALLPYRPEKEPDMYQDIDVRLTVADGVYVAFD
jgi:hypothetical protein